MLVACLTVVWLNLVTKKAWLNLHDMLEIKIFVCYVYAAALELTVPVDFLCICLRQCFAFNVFETSS